MGQEKDNLHLRSRNEREKRVFFLLQLSFAGDAALHKLCEAKVTSACLRWRFVKNSQ